jgi:hypothetical protein
MHPQVYAKTSPSKSFGAVFFALWNPGIPQGENKSDNLSGVV